MPLNAPPSARAESAAASVLALCELWLIIAAHSGVVGAWRLAGVCRAARQGAKEWLRILPGLVVCGGLTSAGGYTREMWRLNMGELRWERQPDLTTGRAAHACCTVRKSIVVLGGLAVEQAGRGINAYVHNLGFGVSEAGVETLGFSLSEAGENIFKMMPPLSCGPVHSHAAVMIDESKSAQGQVLLIGGFDDEHESSARVQKVDLATGVCTAQPALLCPQGHVIYDCMAGRLPDGRVVCVGTTRREYDTSDGESSQQDEEGKYHTMAQVLEPPPHGSPSEASWRWRASPGTSVLRGNGSGGCVLSDGRFAVFGGIDANDTTSSSCEALTLDADGERWDVLPPMHEPRRRFACAAVGGCVIVAGGVGSKTAEVYEEELGRWRRLPCSLPHDIGWMGGTLM